MVLVKVNYTCEQCEFETIDKTKYKRHMLSARHLAGGPNKTPYDCECCNFSTKNKTVYTNHMACKKHLLLSGCLPCSIVEFDEKDFKNTYEEYEELYSDIREQQSDIDDCNTLINDAIEEGNDYIKIQNETELNVLEIDIEKNKILMNPIQKKLLKKYSGHYLNYKFNNWGKKSSISNIGFNYCISNWKKNFKQSVKQIVKQIVKPEILHKSLIIQGVKHYLLPGTKKYRKKQTMNNIVEKLINNSVPKKFRGKPTNRKMYSYGPLYYDKELPNEKTIPKIIKTYFDIDNSYNECFVNVYKHNDLIGEHTDKSQGMDITKNIISISLGIDNNNNIIKENKKIGWMKLHNNKVDIINNKKIELDYNTPHSAKTILKDNLKYRINFTFRSSTIT